MNRIEKRISELEQSAAPASQKWIKLIALPGETNEDCICRHGYTPGDPAVNFIVRAIVGTERNMERKQHEAD